MKQVFAKIKYWLAWYFSKDVLEAINNGATYEEVDNIAWGGRK